MYTEQEFIQAVELNQNIVHKVCNLYMDNAQDKEDLFQEITLQAWKSFTAFKANSKFSTWLYRVALNTAITFFKKEKKQSFIVATAIIPETADHDTSIEEQVNAMHKAIAGLNKIDKALVMLFLEDYSYNDIGDIMGISPNNVAVKMNRIKTKLKETALQYYQHA